MGTFKTFGRMAGVVACMLLATEGSFAMDIQTDRLPNGLEIVVVPDRRAPVVTHSLWYRVGSTDEPKGLTGLSHMLEHLMFKGTPTFGAGVADRLIQKNGGQQNAFTSREMTVYHQTVAKDKLPLVMELEADRVNNLSFGNDLFVPEHSVVSEERKLRTESQPLPRFFERLMRAHFQTHPYGQPVIGWRDDLDAYTRDKAMKWYKEHYAADNAFLLVVGDVDMADVKPLAEKYYGVLPNEKVPARKNDVEALRDAEVRYIAVDSEVQVPVFYRLYRTPGDFAGIAGGDFHKADVAALHVLAEILGGSDTSRLYMELVMKRQLADGASADYDSVGRAEGTFDVNFSPKVGQRVDVVEKALDEVIDGLKTGGVTEKEVARAVTNLLATEVYAQDDADGVMYRLGSWIVAGGKPEDYSAWLDEVQKVKPADVLRVAKSYLVRDHATTGIVVGDAKLLGDLKPVTPDAVTAIMQAGAK